MHIIQDHRHTIPQPDLGIKVRKRERRDWWVWGFFFLRCRERVNIRHLLVVCRKRNQPSEMVDYIQLYQKSLF